MAAKALKRELVGSTSGSKRARKEVASRCSEIVKALRGHDTGLPVDVVNMLAASTEPALRDVKDSRVEHQEVVINWLSSALDSANAKLTERIEQVQAGLNQSQAELAGHEAAVKDASDKLETLNTALVDATSAHGEAEKAFSASHQDLTEKRSQQREHDSKQAALTEQKQKLEALLAGSYAELSTQAGTKKSIDGFVRALKGLKADTALLTSLPGSLAKPQSERSGFDSMVLEQVGEFLGSCIKELASQIDAGAAAVAESASAVTEAVSEAESAQQQLDSATAAMAAAATSSKEGARSLREAKRICKDFMPVIEAGKAQETMAVDALQSFKDGPLASFIFLRDRTSAPAEAQSVAATADAGDSVPQSAPQTEQPLDGTPCQLSDVVAQAADAATQSADVGTEPMDEHSLPADASIESTNACA